MPPVPTIFPTIQPSSAVDALLGLLCRQRNTQDSLLPRSFIEYSGVSSSAQPKTNIISKDLAERREALVTHCQKIYRLQLALAQMESESSKEEAYLDECSKSLSPISRLPSELLLEIFQICIMHADHDETVNRAETVNMSPLWLGQVNARWRQIALSSKRLWSFIIIDLDAKLNQDYTKTTHDTLKILQTYLTRSGSVPLTISVKGIKRFLPNHPILRVLASSSHRWSKAIIDLCCQYLTSDEALGSIQDNLPLLEDLSVDVGWAIGDTFAIYLHPIPQTTLFRSCPRLREVKSIKTTLDQLPWDQITLLEGHRLNARNWLDILKRTKNLKEVKASSLAIDPSTMSSHGGTHTTSNLRIFSLCLQFTPKYEDCLAEEG